jgi:hypothetical protein
MRSSIRRLQQLLLAEAWSRATRSGTLGARSGGDATGSQREDDGDG